MLKVFGGLACFAFAIIEMAKMDATTDVPTQTFHRVGMYGLMIIAILFYMWHDIDRLEKNK